MLRLEIFRKDFGIRSRSFNGGGIIISVSVLKNAKVAAVVHEHIDLFIDLIGNRAWKRDKRKTANEILNFASARVLVDLVRFARISLNDPQVGIMMPKCRVKFRI